MRSCARRAVVAITLVLTLAVAGGLSFRKYRTIS